MTAEKTKALWGQEFRVVDAGLAETDVVIFVEKLMRQHRESLSRLDHIASLHELAQKTVEDAEALAARVAEQARSQSEAESGRIVEEAQGRARAILDEAKTAAAEHIKEVQARAADTEAEYRQEVKDRVATIDSALAQLEASAIQELSTRMSSHYIGKHLHQSVHFLPAFHEFIKALESTLHSPSDDPLPSPGTTDADIPSDS